MQWFFYGMQNIQFHVQFLYLFCFPEKTFVTHWLKMSKPRKLRFAIVLPNTHLPAVYWHATALDTMSCVPFICILNYKNKTVNELNKSLHMIREAYHIIVTILLIRSSHLHNIKGTPMPTTSMIILKIRQFERGSRYTPPAWLYSKSGNLNEEADTHHHGTTMINEQPI